MFSPVAMSTEDKLEIITSVRGLVVNQLLLVLH